MATVSTFNGLIIEWVQSHGQHLVTLTGDTNEKILYHGDNMGEASKVYRQTVRMYEERAKSEK